MPKKLKTPTTQTDETLSVVDNHAQPIPDKAAPRLAVKTKKPAAKKATKRPARKTVAGRVSRGASEPTDEQIRLRAYFISERRHRLALPGNASSDWLEAKRQLLSELGPR